MSTAAAGDERLTVREAAKLIGICPRRILTELVRNGWLPYPDQATQTYSRTQVDAVLRRFAEERRNR